VGHLGASSGSRILDPITAALFQPDGHSTTKQLHHIEPRRHIQVDELSNMSKWVDLRYVGSPGWKYQISCLRNKFM
jgi:hypothetical protein